MVRVISFSKLGFAEVPEFGRIPNNLTVKAIPNGHVEPFVAYDFGLSLNEVLGYGKVLEPRQDVVLFDI